jgi:hypothetical protein
MLISFGLHLNDLTGAALRRVVWLDLATARGRISVCIHWSSQ